MWVRACGVVRDGGIPAPTATHDCARGQSLHLVLSQLVEGNQQGLTPIAQLRALLAGKAEPPPSLLTSSG